jgi:hypothetical protein
MAMFGPGGGDMLLERGPAAHPVLTGDGQLGVVKGGELSRGQPPLRLELEVTQARTVREVTEAVVGSSPWLIGQGSPSSAPADPRSSGWKDVPARVILDR